jgi:polysaccharide biosynthesis protein PslG
VSVRRACLVATLVACTAAAGSTAALIATRPSAPPSRLGIADGGDLQALGARERIRYLDAVKGAGAGWIRIGIYWPVVQRRGPTSYDWAPFDRVVKAARRRGLRILGTILFAPAWARAPGTQKAAPPADPAAFGAFAGRVAAHFRPRGVHAYEIWNEPNIAGFWAGGPDPARYTQLLQASYRAIKRADRSATVVSAGLSPAAAYGAADAQSMNPLTFLERMYASGARGSMDAVGWHPYNFPWGLGYFTWSAWSQMYATSPSARSIMKANGDGKKKIWVTEWGAPTGTSSQSMSEAAQAELVRAGLTRLKTWSWAGPSFLYNFRDKGTNLSDREQNFGLVHYDWSPKPAYSAFRSVASPHH